MENNKIKRTEISEMGEFALIDQLTADVQIHHQSTIKGIGDDAAVIDVGNHYSVVSTDLLIEGIHFDLMYVPLKHLGYKAAIVNLSDIYAMNATPKQLLVSVAISNRFSVEALEEFYFGIKTACNEYKVDLVGGDTSASNKGLIISITAIGESAKDKVVYRSGAQPGDMICVTGDVGASYMGLQLLEREKRIFLDNPEVQPDLENRDYIVGRQLKPEARKDIVDFFHEAGLKPTSMIDVSDGLSSDVLHLCNDSGTGCMLEEEELPIFDETREMAYKFNLDPTMVALNGGEDYELLFTIQQQDLDKIKAVDEGITIIGEMKDATYGYKLKSKTGNLYDLKAQGWKHFND